jgi:hypothetical protein
MPFISGAQTRLVSDGVVNGRRVVRLEASTDEDQRPALPPLPMPGRQHVGVPPSPKR